ncbi:MAG: hypothetical protein J5544_02645 [Clostridia bacterium]|nr:hypothetical protein [Clostridia bacterium]
MKKRFLAAVLALLLTIAVMPMAVADSIGTFDVPEGYDETDYYAALAFLEIEDENGIKNGTKIRSDYNPENPETWWFIDSDEFNWGFIWYETDEGKILGTIDLYHMDVVGVMDMSLCRNLDTFVVLYTEVSEIIAPDTMLPLTISASFNPMLSVIDTTRCTSNLEMIFAHDNQNLINLDLSENTGLVSIYADNNSNLMSLELPHTETLSSIDCYNCDLSSLDLTGLSGLRMLQCYSNHLNALDVSDCNVLMNLDCHANELTELDLSTNGLLFCLDCTGNNINELDFSNNTNIQINGIIAEGDGSIADKTWQPPFYFDDLITYTAYAQPESGSEFLGWFNEDGELLSTEYALDYSSLLGQNIRLIARFTGGEALPGDIDGSGAVNINDALLALRAAMGIIELTPEQISAGDMNGNGSIGVDDAVMILRIAMGLIN